MKAARVRGSAGRFSPLARWRRRAAGRCVAAPLRVLFCCTGVGILNRGIESFFREAFDNLHATPGLEARLVKGGGPSSELERVVRCIPRTSALAAAIGAAARRNAYVAEQWSSFLPVVRQIRRVPARGRLLQRRQSRLPPLLAPALDRRPLPAPVLERRAVPAALRPAGLRPPGQSGLSRGGAARGRARRRSTSWSPTASGSALLPRERRRRSPGGRCASASVCPPIGRWC